MTVTGDVRCVCVQTTLVGDVNKLLNKYIYIRRKRINIYDCSWELEKTSDTRPIRRRPYKPNAKGDDVWVTNKLDMCISRTFVSRTI